MTKRRNLNIARQNEKIIEAIRKGFTAERIRAKWRLKIQEIEALARIRGLTVLRDQWDS